MPYIVGMITKKELKYRIKKRFKSISNFARLGNFDRYRLQIVFANGTNPPDGELQKYIEAYKTLVPKDTNAIEPEKLELLKKKLVDAGGVYKFCKDNPEFQTDQVYLVIKGERKKKSAIVKKLFEKFNIT